MRFVHVADVHLDTSFAGRSEPVRRRLRTASREAFAGAVDCAIREDVHALLIAGDLFDGERLSFETERFLIEQANRLGDHGISVIYATGNHDPGGSTSGPRALDWPACVRLASDATPRRFRINDRSGSAVGVVTAIGHSGPSETRDLSRTLPAPVGELPEVALLHTQVHASSDSERHHPYAPSDIAYLEHAGYDYWALGHVHTPQELCADPPIWYSGSVQGRTHAERGARGCLVVDLSDRRSPLIRFQPLQGVRWETVQVSGLEGVTGLDELERRIANAWHASVPPDPSVEWMARIVVSGPCPLWAELGQPEDRRVLEDELRGVLGVLDVVVSSAGVYPVIPIEEHRARPDVLGEALRLARSIQSGEATLPIPDGTLAGAPTDDPKGRENYIRSLLAESEAEIAIRMLEDTAKR